MDGSKAATEVKIEMGREHKRRKQSAREEKREAAKAKATELKERKEAERAARRTSFKCAHCDTPMLKNPNVLTKKQPRRKPSGKIRT